MLLAPHMCIGKKVIMSYLLKYAPDMDAHQRHGLTLPKLPLPSTIRKLKSASFMRSWLPLESNRAALADLPSVFLPGPILAL